MRPYDRTLDHYYSPDDTSDIFLTEEQVKSALQKIPQDRLCSVIRLLVGLL